MAFQFQGLSSNVTITGSVAVGLPTPASTQTIINVANVGSGSVQNAYTVTAGKSFALFGILQSGTANTYRVYKTDGTTMVMSTTSTDVMSAIPIWIYTAGQIVKVKDALNSESNIFGVEYTP